MQSDLINVEVVYASPTQQKIIALQVKREETIENVIRQSGILTIFPEIDLAKLKVGIFSKTKLLTDKVKEGDRIEIYRPLIIDPKDARRARHKRNQ